METADACVKNQSTPQQPRGENTAQKALSCVDDASAFVGNLPFLSNAFKITLQFQQLKLTLLIHFSVLNSFNKYFLCKLTTWLPAVHITYQRQKNTIFLLDLEEMRFWIFSDRCVLVYNFHTDKKTATSCYEIWKKKREVENNHTVFFISYLVRLTGCKLWIITHIDLWPSFHCISKPSPDERVFTSVTLYVDCRK